MVKEHVIEALECYSTFVTMIQDSNIILPSPAKFTYVIFENSILFNAFRQNLLARKWKKNSD